MSRSDRNLRSYLGGHGRRRQRGSIRHGDPRANLHGGLPGLKRYQQTVGKEFGLQNFTEALYDIFSARLEKGVSTVHLTGKKPFTNPLDTLYQQKGRPTHQQIEEAMSYDYIRRQNPSANFDRKRISPNIAPYLVGNPTFNEYLIDSKKVTEYNPALALQRSGRNDYSNVYNLETKDLDSRNFQYDRTRREVIRNLNKYGQDASIVQHRSLINVGNTIANESLLFNVDVRGEQRYLRRDTMFAAGTESEQVTSSRRYNAGKAISHVGLFTSSGVNIGAETVGFSDIRKLSDKGYRTGTGLGNVLNLLDQQGIETKMRGGELVAKIGEERVSIPLFSKSLGGASSAPGVGEYMFKGGSAFSVTGQVATLGGSEAPLLSGIKSFSQHFYEQLESSIQKNGIGNLKRNVNNILQAQEVFFPNIKNMVESRATDAVGYVDPLQYAGRQKLGRHHLGNSQQILLEVTNTELKDLIRVERERRKEFTGGFKSNVAQLKDSHDAAKKAVMEHLKRMEGEGELGAELAKKLNFAFASQSGEWLFHDNKNIIERDGNSRLFIKMTSAEVKNLSILPGQDLFEKGRQFQLSRGAMKIDSVDQLPAAVAKIMGFGGETMNALSADVKALSSIEQNVALGRRTVGAQFLDSRLNLGLFGDSGVMMSAGLMQDLDYDPTSGFSRHTITSKINMKAIKTADGSLDFRGILRTDLAKAIFEHREMLDKTGSIKFRPGAEIALKAHQKMIAPALQIDPSGKVVTGEKTSKAADLRINDLGHANDILRDAQSRGMDPSKVHITGVRVNRGSGQLELTLAQKGVVTADSGYIFGGHRVSVGQALDTEAVKGISNLIGVSKDLTRSTGLVFGDLGLSPQMKSSPKTSFGFNSTLLSNLAEVVSGKAGTNLEDANVKALTKFMGGRAVKVEIGGKTKIQFQGLGSDIKDFGSNRINDKDFIKTFKALTTTLEGTALEDFTKATFKQVDVGEILKLAPGFDEGILDTISDSNQNTKDLFRRLGLGRVAAAMAGSNTSPFMTTVIKSIGGDIAVREEEPMAKFGTKATKISAREAMFVSESMDFARKGGLSAEKTMAMRSQLFKDLVESHPHLFKKDGELSLALQMLGDKPVLEEGNLLKDIKRGFSGKTIGQTAVLFDDANQVKNITHGGLNKGTSISEVRNTARTYDGKIPVGQLEDTLLGMVKRSADGVNIAQISDKAILIQGPHGPMLIPSPKMMGFAKEEGFVRVPGASSNFDDLETRLFENLKKGRSGVKESQSMYLNILEDVEKIEASRLRGEKLDGLVETLSGKQDRLMRVMATNMLSKQGLMYNSTINPNKMGMAARLRLQNAPSVGVFQVGLTEQGIRNAFTGSKIHKEGVSMFGASSVDEIIERARAGKLYTQVYREPVAGGRQMMAMQVKLLDEKHLRGTASNIDFSGSAFLHSSMVKYGMEGDFDKDSVNLFRLISMNDEGIKAIHEGQKAELHGILDSLKGSRNTILGEGLDASKNTFRNIGDVMDMLGKFKSGGVGIDPTKSAREHSLDSLLDIVQPKHGVPIIEAHFAGRSYVDHMMSNILDLQADSEGKSVIRQNFFARVGEQKAGQLDDFLTKANSLFMNERGGRISTYNYTDARNLTKYMFLKKAAHGGERGHASEIMQKLLQSGRDFAKGGSGYQQEFIDDLVSQGEVRHTQTRKLVDDLAEDLLRAAGTFNDDKAMVSAIDIDPQTGSILQKLADQSTESAMSHARLLAKRMIFSGAMAEAFKGSAAGMSGEGIAKNLSTIIGRIFSSKGAIDPSKFDPYATTATQLTDIQGMQGDDELVDTIHRSNLDSRSEAMKEQRAHTSRLVAEDAISAGQGGRGANVPNSSYRNALISGEFFSKVSRMKYFKPAAAIVGGLAGIEAVRSIAGRFSPGNTPTNGYSSANTMPPAPLMSSPQDPTFARDAMPNTNIARVAKHHGQRSSVNISGKMDHPVDFRGITNNISLNNGYVPNIQGSFRSSLSDTMSQAEMAQFVGDRMGSSF